MMKNYIIDLKFDNTQWRVWLSGEDSPEAEENWKKALKTLGTVGDSCTHAPEFFAKAMEHFKQYGFVRVEG